jgi:hypothetical protein
MAVLEQLLGGQPVVDFDALQAAAINPEVVGLFLDLGFGRRGDRRGWLVFHGVALVEVAPLL